MFRPRVQHMVQKADARPYPDMLQVGNLGSMCFGILVLRGGFRIMISGAVVLKFCGRRQEIERSAIKTERELNLGLIGVADDVGGSPIRRGHGVMYGGEAVQLNGLRQLAKSHGDSITWARADDA